MELTTKDKKYRWENKNQIAFGDCKKIFIDNIVLKHQQLHKEYNLYTDASDFAIAGVLTQIDDQNNERIITCISRVLKGPELFYFTTEKELLAIKWSLENLHMYIFGIEVNIYSDHKVLSFLKSC